MLFEKSSFHIERNVKTVIILACIVLALKLNICTITDVNVSLVRVTTVFSNFVLLESSIELYFSSFLN